MAHLCTSVINPHIDEKNTFTYLHVTGSYWLHCWEKKSKNPVHIVSTRMDVFYFKVDKAFLGAQLEIYSAEGVQLHSEKITRRKVRIDFYYEDAESLLFVLKRKA